MKTPSELYYEYGEKVEIPQGATEAFMITEYKFVKALEEYTQQQVSVEPVVILQKAVKEKIVEMIDKYSDHLKTPYVEGNNYLTNRYEGKIDALETLMIELMRDSFLSK